MGDMFCHYLWTVRDGAPAEVPDLERALTAEGLLLPTQIQKHAVAIINSESSHSLQFTKSRRPKVGDKKGSGFSDFLSPNLKRRHREKLNTFTWKCVLPHSH